MNLYFMLVPPKMSRGAVIFQPYCSCGNSLGSKQYLFEENLAKGMTRSEAAKAVGFTLMCCLSNTLYAPIHFIVSSNKDRVKDEVGHIKKPGRDPSTGVYVEHTPLIILKTLPPPFPAIPGGAEGGSFLFTEAPKPEVVLPPIMQAVPISTSIGAVPFQAAPIAFPGIVQQGGLPVASTNASLSSVPVASTNPLLSIVPTGTIGGLPVAGIQLAGSRPNVGIPIQPASIAGSTSLGAKLQMNPLDVFK